ncbi:hypothetical protein [Colwellia sp. MEBiC06753]
MKKFLAIAPCLLASWAVNASDVNVEQLQKQIGIMDNIIKSSVGNSGNNQGIKLSSVESTYLMNQGVVIALNTSARSGSWGNYNFVIPPLPPMPTFSPDQIESIEAEIQVASEMANIDVDKTFAKAMENASRSYERAIEKLHGNREEVRELHEEQRDIEYELRDIEREHRDIEFQMRRADKDEKPELTKEKEQLAEKRKALLEQKNMLTKRSQEFKAKQAETAKQSELARVEYFKSLSKEVAETLCLYGNGLKALPKNEHVTVIMKSGGALQGRHYQDNIYVFSKRDINGCAIDDITSAQLLEKSKNYQF